MRGIRDNPIRQGIPLGVLGRNSPIENGVLQCGYAVIVGDWWIIYWVDSDVYGGR